MKTEFVVNDYILVWNLLFTTSISEKVYPLRQKIADTYKEEYKAIHTDIEEIIKDYKNFIPNNDTVYNIVMENKEYENIKKQVEQYRIDLMGIWDKNKTETEYLIQKILRKEILKCTIFVVDKELNTVKYLSEDKLMVGREIEKKNSLNILLDIMMEISTKHVKRYKEEYQCFKEAILELAILNEYATRLTKKSSYHNGNPKLSSLKKWLYPYWLMYLGVEKEEFSSYMMRDKMEFDVSKYAYEKELKKMDIEEFIEFCIRNRRYIIRDREIKQEEIL